MTASLVFTDAIGAATLTNAKPGAGGRFANWTPLPKPVGDSVNRLSDGALAMFAFRTDYGASFQLAGIPVATVGGVRPVDLADRLCAWLTQGGVVTVNTGDVESNSYATCSLAPGSVPRLTLTDKRNLEYTLELSLINIAASPTPMRCHYAA